MVGQAIVRQLEASGERELIRQTRKELDLTDQSAVRDFFSRERIDTVYLAAARVGGIFANDRYPADFIYDNLMIEANVIHQAFRAGVRRLLFLGSSCIYPKHAQQPMTEEALLTGTLEPTNEPYAIAKIAGIKLCESYNRQYGDAEGVDFRSVMPTNLYGPGDNYHPENSHVVPALIRRFCDAADHGLPHVTIWGSGTPRREFLHVEDMAAASLFVMDLARDRLGQVISPMRSHLNVGFGNDVTIAELARMIGKAAGFTGTVEFDTGKPDGAPRKLMDTTRLRALGWTPRISLEEGLRRTVSDYRASGQLASR